MSNFRIKLALAGKELFHATTSKVDWVTWVTKAATRLPGISIEVTSVGDDVAVEPEKSINDLAAELGNYVLHGVASTNLVYGEAITDVSEASPVEVSADKPPLVAAPVVDVVAFEKAA